MQASQDRNFDRNKAVLNVVSRLQGGFEPLLLTAALCELVHQHGKKAKVLAPLAVVAPR
jgi:hypothetical protein